MLIKLLGSIGVDFEVTGQLPVMYSAFIKCLREIGIQWCSTAAVCGLQENLFG
jgi:hypothetical protein